MTPAGAAGTAGGAYRAAVETPTLPMLTVRNRAGKVLLSVPIHPNTAHEVVVADAARLTTTSIEYRRRRHVDEP